MEKKFNNTPKKNQINALNSIYNHYNEYKNTKVIIYGERGTGKTYISKLVKNLIDTNLHLDSLLYDDFDPSSIGVNIKKIALKNANENTPVIIVINEIDRIFYDIIYEKKQSYNSQGYHTKNKASFNNMMDSIADTNNVILICTTEKSRLSLENNSEYLSFFRKGRIDFFINMTFNESIIETII